MPNRASSVDALCISPYVNSVAGCATSRPAFFSPMKAMKRPMPTATVPYGSAAITSTMTCRTPTSVNSRNATPERNNRAKGHLPWDAHAFADRISEVGVESHARRQGNRTAGKHAHQDAADGGRQTRRSDDGLEGHAGFLKDGGVHEDDVRHRDEGRESGQNFGAPVGAERVEFEIAFEAGSHYVRNRTVSSSKRRDAK